MIRLLVFAVIVFAAVAATSYSALPHLLPALFTSQNPTETARQLELLKVLSGALAAAVTGLLAAGNSMLMIGRQLSANKDLETHKGEILRALEDKKSTLAKELENEKTGYVRSLEDHKNGLATTLEARKNELAGQLDTQRQELAHELGLRRLEIEDAFSQITSLRDAVTAYRYTVGELRRGEFNPEAAAATRKTLDHAMDCSKSNAALYGGLETFRQRGLFLEERAERIETRAGQRNLWREPSKVTEDGGAPLGPRFAANAEMVLGLLSTERERVLKDQ